MDLYEALKAGNSSEDLLKKFHEELDAANARLVEEAAASKEAERKATELMDARTYLADAIIEYGEALFGDKPFTLTEVEDILKDFEKEVKDEFSILKTWGNLFTKEDKPKNTKSASIPKKPIATVKITHEDGNDFNNYIFEKFLDSLK